MTATTESERQAATNAEDLELAGLLLATLPRLGKMAMAATEPRRRDVAAA